jgi:hypothetical protein
MDLRDGFSSKLGLDKFAAMLCPVPGKMNKFCIKVPSFELGVDGVKSSEIEACLDFDELVAQEWVLPLRQVLLFMVVCGFVSAIVVVLRQY